MSDLSISDVGTAAPAAQGSVVDRRRPGRPATVSPALIPLLRAPHAPDSVPTSAADLVDDAEEGNAPRGIIISLAIALPFWATVCYLVLR